MKPPVATHGLGWNFWFWKIEGRDRYANHVFLIKFPLIKKVTGDQPRHANQS